jgi:glycosyltransferase involved in cell wall biosynthesis
MTHDRPEFIEDCLRSILAQTFKDYRLVVLHDPGKKEYGAILSQFSDRRMIYLKHERNIGQIANVQAAFQNYLDSKYLMVFHDDDMMHPQLVEFEIDIMEKYGDLQFVASESIVFLDSDDLPPYSCASSEAHVFEDVSQLALELLRGARLHFGSTMYRTSALPEFNWPEFERKYSPIFDRALLLQAASPGRSALLRSRMVFYRLHENQVSANLWTKEEHFINLYGLYRGALEPNWDLKSAYVFYKHSGYWLPWTYKRLDPHHRSPFLTFVRKCRRSGILCVPFMLFFLAWNLEIEMAHALRTILPKSIYDRLRNLRLGS